MVALFLVLLLSIESFGAVVSDNDGSAFITKAEFDSLKINFQSQIDQYNTSIDSKIDGAIASYLAGIDVKKKQEVNTLIKNDYKYLESFGNDNWLPLRHQGIKGTIKCGAAALGVDSALNGTRMGLTVTTYTMRHNDLYLPSLRADVIGNTFYNMNLVYGNINVNATRFTPNQLRWLSDGLSMNKLYMGINQQQYWNNSSGSGASAVVTMNNNYKTSRNNGGFQYIGAYITSTSWTNSDMQKYNPEKIIYYDSSSNERKILDGYNPNLDSTTIVTTIWDHMVSWRAYNNYPGTDKNNAWQNMTGVAGSMSTTDAKWELAENPNLTLALLSNNTYTVKSVVWPMNLSGGQLIQTLTDQVTWSELGFDCSSTYYWMYENPVGSGNWKRDTGTTASESWGSTFIATSKNDSNNYYHVQPKDWTWKTYIFDSIDMRQFFKWNKDILRDEPSDKLKSYLANNPASRGIPIYETKKAGEFEFSPCFDDTSKEYDIWVCKGPCDAYNFDSVTPTNTYTLKKRTQNANKSYTIKSGDKLTLDIEKDDVVYITWSEKGKKGGGAIVNPIEAYFTEDD